MSADERIAELEEALRSILDVTTGWTRPMSPQERIAAIEQYAYDALGVARDGAA